ncbi:serine/threonine-protein kinase [Paraliomyxa miuraensis]|uniref:serine/threonine-protein kinase n=1 Tax=Paraliomyxa miuraensis TaxID=376150 RepID=UPI002253FDB0|nr:serine/threonine-protein kinase [Paraliomyxa miuraensis]MCX4241404.1 protein kinase [Paraliomyxa miuraensis]
MDSQLGIEDSADAEESTRAGAGPVLEASRIGRYQILRELGAGGMGIVYAAYDESLNRRVALKLLLRETPITTARLRREAQAMARISHPNVVQIFEVGEHDGQLFVAMEYIEGISLTRWLAEQTLTWTEIIDVFIRAGRGLQAAHEAGVVHRDFKPDNVMIQRAGADGGHSPLRVKVLDFGIAIVDPEAASLADELPVSAKDVPSHLTRAGARVGTPMYMSPEHALGQTTDPRSDQFSFAIALYEALYGHRPFEGEDVEQLLEAVVRGKLRPEPRDTDVPAWAHETLARALAVDPGQRWGSMDELLVVLAEHPERTDDPELDRTVALRQRLWMLSVLTLGGLGLLGTLLLVRVSASGSGFDEYAFWSKVLFGSSTGVALVATKHVFRRNHYNQRVFAMVMALALATVAITICSRLIELSAEQTDRFMLVVAAAIFGQGSASVGRWLGIVPVLALVGLAASFVFPFAAPLTLGICVVCGSGMTAYFWSRRRPVPGAGSPIMRTSAASTDGDGIARGQLPRLTRSTG